MRGNGGHSATEEQVSAIAACFGCGDGAARLLGQSMIERHFERRAVVALRGDSCAQVFLVLEGGVAAEIFGIEGQHAQLARHGPGEIFGAYPMPGSYRADISATSDTKLLSIGTLELAALAHSHAEIGAGLSRLLARQLDLLLDRMAARIGLSAVGRFHKALLDLADANGVLAPAPVISALALSVNTTRETGSRALATLLRRGIVERQGDALRIVSRRMLEEMVV
jgi:CRP/FNR family transcriptional regulator, cyclic AMP receptor protein